MAKAGRVYVAPSTGSSMVTVNVALAAVAVRVRARLAPERRASQTFDVSARDADGSLVARMSASGARTATSARLSRATTLADVPSTLTVVLPRIACATETTRPFSD